MQTIKVLSESIEKLRQELTATTANMTPKVKPALVKAEMPATPKPVSKQQASIDDVCDFCYLEMKCDLMETFFFKKIFFKVLNGITSVMVLARI